MSTEPVLTRRKSMWMNVFYVVGAVLAVFLVVVALQPSDFKITRSATIAAPASRIFPHVNNLRSWEEWSPWAKLDPNAKSSFEGTAEGVGAIMRWAGNMEVGEGSMTISESRPNEFIQFKMEFIKPMPGTSTAEFSFKPEGSGTRVTWSMYGKNNFMGKAMSLIMNCDKMVGGQFDKGLASMKTIVEGQK